LKEKLWTKNFVLAAVANLLIYFVYYLLMVIVAKHASVTMNAAPWEAGLASSLFILGGLVARIVAGRLNPRFGDKKILLFGLGIYLVTSLLYFPVNGIGGLLVVRSLHGFGFGFSATGTNTMAAHIIPEKRRGEGISYFALSMMLASALGPFTGMTVSQNSSFNTTLFVAVGAVLLCLAIAPFITDLHRVRQSERQSEEAQPIETPSAEAPPLKAGRFSIRDFLEPSALPVSILGALVVFAYCSVLSFLSSFTDTPELMAAGTWFFVVYSVFALVVRPFTGLIFDRRGENILIFPSIIVFSAGLLTLAVSHTGLVLLCSAALIGLGYGTFFSTANAVVLQTASQDRVHLASTTYFSFVDLGAGIAPFFLGLIISLTGYRGMYIVMAIFVFCLTGVYYLVHGRKAARKRAEGKAEEEAGAAPGKAEEEAGSAPGAVPVLSDGMKMLVAIVHEDAERELTAELNRNGFRATRLSTTGGFLRRANATLLIGTLPDEVPKVMDILRASGGSRRRVRMEALGVDPALSQYAEQVDIGGATVFVLNIEHFEQM